MLKYTCKILSYIVLLLILCSCHSFRVVEVERVLTDTLYEFRERWDSIYMHDSVYASDFLVGDTVWRVRDRWHTKYVERLRVDTVFHSRVDSVPVPYEVPVEVPARLSFWQSILIGFGRVSLAAFAILFCWLFLRFSRLRS